MIASLLIHRFMHKSCTQQGWQGNSHQLPISALQQAPPAIRHDANRHLRHKQHKATRQKQNPVTRCSSPPAIIWAVWPVW